MKDLLQLRDDLLVSKVMFENADETNIKTSRIAEAERAFLDAGRKFFGEPTLGLEEIQKRINDLLVTNSRTFLSKSNQEMCDVIPLLDDVGKATIEYLEYCMHLYNDEPAALSHSPLLTHELELINQLTTFEVVKFNKFVRFLTAQPSANPQLETKSK